MGKLAPSKLISLITVVFASFLTMFSCQQDGGKQVSLYYNQGMQLGLAGDFEGARRAFEAALQVEPRFAPADGNLILLDQLTQERVKAAAVIHIFRAIDYGNRNRQEQKIKEINLAIELSPQCAFSYNERGIAYFELGLFDRAVSDRDRAIELDPTYAAPYYNKAIACEKLGQIMQALDAYKGFILHADKKYSEHVEYARWRIDEIEKWLKSVQRST